MTFIDVMRRKTRLMESKVGQFFMSGIGALLSWWVIWPIEVIKNQIQAETREVGRSWRDKLRYMIATHGRTGPFRGMMAGSISIFTRNGFAMVTLQYL